MSVALKQRVKVLGDKAVKALRKAQKRRSRALTEAELWKLPRRQRALLIAKDVLKHLKVMQVTTTGEYCNAEKAPSCDKKDSAKDYVAMLRKDCSVCAKGAMFLSHIGLFNKVPMKDLLDEEYQYNPRTGDYDKKVTVINVSEHDIATHLKAHFLEEDFDNIEKAFEDRGSFDSDYGWGSDYPDASDRLEAIMQRVVKNAESGKDRLFDYENDLCRPVIEDEVKSDFYDSK